MTMLGSLLTDGLSSSLGAEVKSSIFSISALLLILILGLLLLTVSILRTSSWSDENPSFSKPFLESSGFGRLFSLGAATGCLNSLKNEPVPENLEGYLQHSETHLLSSPRCLRGSAVADLLGTTIFLPVASRISALLEPSVHCRLRGFFKSSTKSVTSDWSQRFLPEIGGTGSLVSNSSISSRVVILWSSSSSTGDFEVTVTLRASFSVCTSTTTSIRLLDSGVGASTSDLSDLPRKKANRRLIDRAMLDSFDATTTCC